MAIEHEEQKRALLRAAKDVLDHIGKKMPEELNCVFFQRLTKAVEDKELELGNSDSYTNRPISTSSGCCRGFSTDMLDLTRNDLSF